MVKVTGCINVIHGIMYQSHTNIDVIKIHVYAEVRNDLCFTVRDFAFYLEDCLMDQLHTWGRVNGSV